MSNVQEFITNVNPFIKIMREYRDRVEVGNFFELREDGLSPKDMRVRTIKGDAAILPTQVVPVSDEWVSKTYQYLRGLVAAMTGETEEEDVLKLKEETDANHAERVKNWQDYKANCQAEFVAKRKARGIDETLEQFWDNRVEPLIDAYAEWNRMNKAKESAFWASPAGLALTKKKRDRMAAEACEAASEEAVATYAYVLRTGVKIADTKSVAVKDEEDDEDLV